MGPGQALCLLESHAVVCVHFQVMLRDSGNHWARGGGYPTPQMATDFNSADNHHMPIFVLNAFLCDFVSHAADYALR